MFSPTLALGLLTLFVPQNPTDPIELVVGTPVEVTITEKDPAAHTEVLDRFYGKGPHRAKRVVFELEDGGLHHLEIEARAFAPYVILRNEDGVLLTEDEPGRDGRTVVVVRRFGAEERYGLEVAALASKGGDLRVKLVRGGPPRLSEPQLRERLSIMEGENRVAATAPPGDEASDRYATALNDLGYALKRRSTRSSLLRSRHCYERALAIREEIHGPNHRRVGASLNNLAALHLVMGDYASARATFEKVVPIFEAAYGTDDPNFAMSLNNLATVLLRLGEWSAARPLFERALAIREEALGPDDVMVAQSQNNLAVLLESLGDYSAARPLLERGLATREKALGPDHGDVAESLSSLGQLLDHEGDHAAAQPLLERALAIREKVHGPEHPQVAAALTTLGVLLYTLKDFEPAQSLLERALAIREKTLGSAHPQFASSLNNLGIVLMARGRFTEARTAFRRSLEIVDDKLGAGHFDAITTRGNLATALKHEGNFEAARPLIESVIAAREKFLGADHPDLAAARNNLASLLLRAGDPEAAWGHSRSALASTRAHLRRNLWSMTEAARLEFAVRQRTDIELHLAVARRLGEKSAEARGLGYDALLWWKGKVARGLAEVGRDLASLDDATTGLLRQLHAVKGRLSDSALGRSMGAFSADSIDALRREKRRLEERLFRELRRTEDSAVDPRSVAERLPPDGVLVDFLIHRENALAPLVGGRVPRVWTRPKLSAWVLRPGGDILRFDLGPAGVIGEAVKRWLKFVSVQRGDDPGEAHATRKSVEQLLWTPLAEAVGDARHVIVCPDSFLGTVPFGLLRGEDGGLLIEKHCFSWVGDAASLVDLPNRSLDEEHRALLAAGAVDYRRCAAPPAPPPTGERRGRGFDSAWTPLLYSGPEVRATTGLHEYAFEDATRTLLQKTEATEERIKLEMPKHRYIHLATHGFFAPAGVPSMWEQAKEQARTNLENDRQVMRPEMKRLTGVAPGLLSGIVLAGANESEEGREGGILTAEEITWMDLSKCELVVLSACESGLGTPRGGEGMIGLRRSFRIAGAGAVISSLWKVDDASTAELMKSFYTNLWIKKLGKMESLRQAQLSMLEKNRREHKQPLPGTWGAFVLDGDWR